MSGPRPLGSPRGKLSVLLYESDQNALDAYVHAFRKIFALAGYEADIVPLASGGESTSRDSGALFDNAYFDMLISDVSLGDIGNKLGLRFLTKIKDRHPDIFTVAFTGHPITFRSCSNNYRFDLYVDKERVEVKRYQEYVANLLQRELLINPHAVVKSRREDFWPDMTDAQWLDLQRILRRITFTGPPNAERSHISNLRLRRIDGGYSGAHVFSLQARTGSGQTCVQAVLKVACTDQPEIANAVRSEVSNYKTMVRWHLPYHWRPELLGSASSAHLEALCYAFVSTREEPFETLRKFVREGRAEVVTHAIDSIFHPTRRRWYDARNVRKEDRLVSFYLDHCFGEGPTERHLDIFRRTLRHFDTSAPDKVCIGELEVPSPNLMLFGKPAGGCQSCLIHGDLNTSNVFLSTSGDGSDVMLIDFASTRRGHVFFDFIVFEVNLRLDHRERVPFDVQRRIVQERALNNGQSSEVPCAEQILLLRRYAAQNFGDERWDTYLYGVAAFCFSLMTAPNLSEIDHQILASAICAALADLQQRRFLDAANLSGARDASGRKSG